MTNHPNRRSRKPRRSRRRRRPGGQNRPPAPNQAQNRHGFPLEDDESFPGETAAEHELWKQLHRLNSETCRMVRGHHVGQHAVGFACPDKRLAIDVLAGTLSDDDRRRDNELAGFGWRTLRFTEAEVNGSIDAILALVDHALKVPTAAPAPQANKLRRFVPQRRVGPPRQPGQHRDRGRRSGNVNWNR